MTKQTDETAQKPLRRVRYPKSVGNDVVDMEHALPAVSCDGHYGPGMLRDWDECPICNPPEGVSNG